jgi:outer membrane biosynthesis protein TonB
MFRPTARFTITMMAKIWRVSLLAVMAILLFSTAARESPAPIPSMSRMQLTFEVLSASHEADFEDYLGKLEASVKRNWYTVMPESALLGKKGIVTLTLHVRRNGTLPADDPTFQSVSGTEAFDKAAADSVRISAPFERLPSSVQSRSIKLRVVFYYNLPGDSPKGTSRPPKSQIVTQVSD